MLILLLLIPVATGVLLFSAYSSATRLPRNRPDRFLSEKNSDHKVIACLGDSLTHGTVSYNYVEALEKSYKGKQVSLVNAGVNSDLAYNLLQRIDPVIHCKPSLVTVLIGTNDVNAVLCENGHEQYKAKQLPQRPDIEWYEDQLRQTVQKLKQSTSASIALISPPIMGENMTGETHGKVGQYGEIVRKIAQEEAVEYLPLFEEMTAVVKQAGMQQQGFARQDWAKTKVKAVFRRFVLGQSFNKIGLSMGYYLLSDGIHLNERGGEILQRLVNGFIVEHLKD
ncbi:MAG: SGNH/GDSL hydrolase family protein [Endozoicomonas sp.]|uniref:SGNH/GDSL hydrolase family protein n=1 Tax=Endozoicomonas sp. TaxID=1892382 RepID=UPI003D9BCFBF